MYGYFVEVEFSARQKPFPYTLGSLTLCLGDRNGFQPVKILDQQSEKTLSDPA